MNAEIIIFLESVVCFLAIRSYAKDAFRAKDELAASAVKLEEQKAATERYKSLWISSIARPAVNELSAPSEDGKTIYYPLQNGAKSTTRVSGNTAL